MIGSNLYRFAFTYFVICLMVFEVLSKYKENLTATIFASLALILNQKGITILNLYFNFHFLYLMIKWHKS